MVLLTRFAFPFAVFACGLFAGVSAAYLAFQPDHKNSQPRIAESSKPAEAQPVAVRPEIERPRARAPASTPSSKKAARQDAEFADKQFHPSLWESRNFGALSIRYHDARKKWFKEKVRSEFQMPFDDFNPWEKVSKVRTLADVSKFWRARIKYNYGTGHTVEFELRYYTGELVVVGAQEMRRMSDFQVDVWKEGRKLNLSSFSVGAETALRAGKEYLFLSKTITSFEESETIFQYFMAPLPGEGGPAMFLSVALSVWHTTEDFEWEPMHGMTLEQYYAGN